MKRLKQVPTQFYDIVRTTVGVMYNKDVTARTFELVLSDALAYIDYEVVDGNVAGFLMAVASPRNFQRRQQHYIVAWFAEKGYGLPLMRKYLEWLDSKPSIRWVSFRTELPSNLRAYNLISKRYPLSSTVWDQ